MADVKVIFDTGAFETRVGLSIAGDSPAPSLCFPSIVGRPTFPLGGGSCVLLLMIFGDDVRSLFATSNSLQRNLF